MLRKGLLVLLILAGSVVTAAIFWVQSEGFEDWARHRIQAALQDRYQLDAGIETIRLHLWSSQLELAGMTLFTRDDPADEPLLEVKALRVSYSLRSLLSGQIRIERLNLNQPVVRIHETADGILNLAKLAESTKRTGAGVEAERDWTVQIGEVSLDNGRILFRGGAFELDSASAGLKIDMDRSAAGNYQGTVALKPFELSVGPVVFSEAAFETRFVHSANRLDFREAGFEAAGLSAHFDGSINDLRELRYLFHLREADVGNAVFRQLLPAASLVETSVAATGQVEGEGKQFAFHGDFSAPRLVASGLRFDNLKGHAFWDRDRLAIESAETTLLGARLRFEAELLAHRDSTLSFTTSEMEIGRLLNHFRLAVPGVAGRLKVDCRLAWPGFEWTQARGNGRASLSGRLGSGLDSEPLDGRAAFQVRSDRIQVNDFEVETGGSALQGSAQIERRGESILALKGVVVDPLRRHLLQQGWLASELGPEKLAHLVLPRRIEFDGQMRLGDGPVQARGLVSLDQAQYKQFSLVDIGAGVDFDGWRLRVDNMEASHGEARLAGSLEIHRLPEGWGIPDTVDLRFDNLPLEGLPVAALEAVHLTGTVSGRLQLARDQEEEPTGRLDLGAHKAAWNNTEIAELDIVVLVDGSSLKTESLRANVFGGSISGRLQYDTASQIHELVLQLRDAELLQLPLVEENFEIAGTVSVDVESRGDLENPEIEFHATSRELKILSHAVPPVSIRGRSAAGRLHLSGHTQVDSQPLEFDGEISLAEPRQIEVSSRLSGFSLGYPIRQESGEATELNAQVWGRVALSGPLTEPDQWKWNAALDRLELEVSKQPLRLAQPNTVRLENGRLKLDRLRLVGDSTNLSVSGDIEVTAETLNLQLEGNADFAAVAPLLGAESGSGQLDLTRLNVTGSFDTPRLVGQIKLQDGTISHPRLPLSLFGMEGSFRFTSSQISIESLSTNSNFGRFHAVGDVFLQGFDPVRWRVNAYGNGLVVPYPDDFTSLVDIDVDLINNLGAHLISGFIYVRSARHFRNVAVAELITSYGEMLAPAQTGPDGAEVALDVGIEGFRTIRVSNNLADLTASAELVLRGTLTDPVLTGTISVDEGVLTLEGNHYQISQGLVNFNNPRRTAPVFNFEADTTVREFRIQAAIQGPLDRLRMSFNSEPPLPTPGIVALLATGQTGEELFGSETTARPLPSTLAIYGAGSLLSQTVGQQLESRTSRLLGFDKFSIDPFIDTGVRDPGARITLGKQITSDLGVTSVTGLGGQLRRQSIIIEYQLTDWLTAVGTGEEDGTLAIDFKVRKRF